MIAEPKNPASVWAQLTERLSRFKNEIEDRVPAYFAVCPLRLLVGEEAYLNVHTQQSLPVTEYVRMLAQAMGMRLEIVTDAGRQNYVDRLFTLRAGALLADLDQAARAAVEGKPQNPSADQIWFTVPSASLQEPVCKPAGAGKESVEWKSFFKQKQVVLPDGVVLNYYDGGQGEKILVLLNAYGQSFRYWERFIQAVCPRLRIILWMPRGNEGDTIGLKLASPLAVHADDLEQVLRQEGIERCTLLAWCSGPKLALEYYQRHPGRISSMVFVAGSFKCMGQHKALETEYEKNLDSLLETIERYPETSDVVLEYLKGILLAQGKQAHSSEELATISDHDLQQALCAVNVSLQELVLQPFHAANVVAYARQMRDFWKYDFAAALGKVEVPVLFVGGDCDRIASQAIAKVIAGMVPQGKYLEIKGGTHYIHYDQWDLLAEVTEQIVNSGDKIEFRAAWGTLAEFHQESMTARQS